MCQRCTHQETASSRHTRRAATYVLLHAGVQRRSYRQDLSEDALAAEYRAVSRLKDPLIRHSRKRLEELWARVAREAGERAAQLIPNLRTRKALPWLRAEDPDPLASSILSYDDLLSDLQEVVEEETRAAIREGFTSGQLRIDRKDITLDFSSPRVDDTLTRVIQQVEESALTASNDVLDVVQEGLDEGADTQTIAGRVRKALSDNLKRKAWDITTTSVTGGFELAQLEAYQKGGVQTKAWLSTRDDQVRPTHLNADQQQQDLDKPFVVGSALLMYPGDPRGLLEEIIRCRCTSRPLLF